MHAEDTSTSIWHLRLSDLIRTDARMCWNLEQGNNLRVPVWIHAKCVSPPWSGIAQLWSDSPSFSALLSCPPLSFDVTFPAPAYQAGRYRKSSCSLVALLFFNAGAQGARPVLWWGKEGTACTDILFFPHPTWVSFWSHPHSLGTTVKL